MVSLLEQPLNSVPVAVLDFEMTGLNPELDRVCEVAIVRGSGGKIEVEFNSLVRPDREMSSSALRVHGITEDMLKGAPAFEKVAPRVAEMLDGAVLVCHNVPFDICFLHREMAEAGRPLAPPVSMDTLMIARRLFAFPRNNLETVCEHLKVELVNAHRARGDAIATFEAYWKMVNIVDPTGDVTVGELLTLLEALAPNSPTRLQHKGMLRQAHREQRTLWIDYKATGDPAKGVIRREVGIWHMKLPYFQAWCYLRCGERVFRLDRMTRIEKGDRTYDIPEYKSRI